MIRGVDLSAANHLSIWSQVDAWGARWVYLKATAYQRTAGHVVDRAFRAHLAEATRRGLEVGAYHFLDSRTDPVAQAEHHWRTIEGLPLALVSALDWEPGEDYDPATGKLRERWSAPTLEQAEAWTTRYRQLSGKRPAIYCGFGYTDEIGALVSPILAECPLWVAQYPGNATSEPIGNPRLPHIWGCMPQLWADASRGFAAWQFVGAGMDRSVATPDGLAALRAAPAETWTPVDCRTIQLSPIVPDELAPDA